MSKLLNAMVFGLITVLIVPVAKALELPAYLRLRPKKIPFIRDNCEHCQCARPAWEFELSTPLPDPKILGEKLGNGFKGWTQLPAISPNRK